MNEKIKTTAMAAADAMTQEPKTYSESGSSTASSVHDGRLEQGLVGELEWKPGNKEYAVMLTLALISLMVALDATILVSVLPVGD